MTDDGFAGVLRRYMQRSGKTVQELARELGRSQACVYFWLQGERRPDARSAIDLERVTGGEIPRALSRPDYFAPDSAA